MEEKQTIIQTLEIILQQFFKDDKIIVSETTTAHDIEAWDSLNHMNLISTIEKQFNIQFDFFEVMNFENIGELVKSIQNKL